jgi:hypothetical protein
MVIDRRSLLAGIGAAVGLSLLPRDAFAGAEEQLYISALSDGAEHSVAMFSADGVLRFSTRLPDRGHDSVRRPKADEVIVFARRPGNWAAVVDLRNGAVGKVLIAPEGRHFYGHGAFSPDGGLLYATENDIAAGTGVLGLYDARDDYRRIGEVPSFGVGPHDLLFRPGSTHLVVANGGIRTHPDTGREMLNKNDMEPSIAVVDAATGDLKLKVDLGPDMRGLSIRHLAMAPDGTAAFGCQFEGDPFEMPALVGLIMPDGGTRFLEMPDEELAALNNYVGSVELDASGDIIAATCPRGGTVAFWDRTSGRYLGRRQMPDVCGVAATSQADGMFLLTSGNAGVRMADLAQQDLRRLTADVLGSHIWDNHLLRL